MNRDEDLVGGGSGTTLVLVNTDREILCRCIRFPRKQSHRLILEVDSNAALSFLVGMCCRW